VSKSLVFDCSVQAVKENPTNSVSTTRPINDFNFIALSMITARNGRQVIRQLQIGNMQEL